MPEDELLAEITRLRKRVKELEDEHDEAVAAAIDRGARALNNLGHARRIGEIVKAELHALQHLRQSNSEWGNAYDRQRARAEKAEALLKKLGIPEEP